MSTSRRRGSAYPAAIATGLAVAALSIGGSALAGQGGNLEPIGALLLELDAATSRFRLDDGDAATPDRVQLVFDQKLLKAKDACRLGLSPDGSDPSDPGSLVSLSGSPTEWGIDAGKFALGARTGKGTGCGQLEFGEVARLRTPTLLLTDASVQVEAKQDASVRVTLILDDGIAQTVVGTRYLLSGRAVSNPPAEVAAAPPEHVSVVLGNRPDGGPDSGEQDDGFWNFSASFHNVEVYEILTNADGTQGKLSLKGGGEFPNPSANRSEWTVFQADGLLACGDAFSNETGTVTGNRTNEGACTTPIPYDLEFDGQEVNFQTLDLANDGTGFALRIAFDAEAAVHPIDPTILAYAASGIDCSGGEFTESCIPLGLCVGTPLRRCADGTACREDADCADGSACRLVDLLPPAGGFPDLVSGTATLEYGCVCEEDVLYLGPGTCGDGASCAVDADCVTGSCELFPDGDRIAVEQCVFFVGDPHLRRSR